MKTLPRQWRLRTMMGLVLVVAVGIRLCQKLQDGAPPPPRKGGKVTVAQRLLDVDVQLGAVDPRKLFTEQELVTALSNRDPAVHHAAYWALDESGSTSPALVRALVGQLETESEQSWFESRRDPRQINVVASLKRIKVPAPTLARLLAKAITSKDRWVRLRATEVLCDAAGRPGPTDQGMAGLLLKALRDEEARIRTLSAEALAGLDPATRRQAVAVLLGQFRDSEPPRAFEAVVGLARFDPEAKEAVKILTDRLEKGDAADRLANLYLLGRLGPLARPAVPSVVRAMTSRDAGRLQPPFLGRFSIAYNGWHSDWRSWVADKYLNSGERLQTPSNLCDLGASVLGRIGPEAEREAVDALAGMLRDDDESQLLGAVGALKALGPAASSALPALMALSAREASDRPGKDHDVLMRAVAESLDKVGKGSSEQVVETLVGMLKSRDPAKRLWAAQTLNHQKQPARSAVPALIEAMKDTTQGVRYASALALGRYDGPEGEAALPALLAAMKDEDLWVRGNACKSLASHGEAAREAIPEVVRLLRSLNASLRYQAAQTLGDFGPVAGEAVPALLVALDDEEEFVRESAGKALAEVTPAASVSAGEALAGLGQGDASHRRGAACDLVRPGSAGKAGADAAAVELALRGALGDPDPTVRETAAAALGHLGRHPGAATPALIAALGDGSVGVRVAAATALGRVAPGDPDAVEALAGVMEGQFAEVRGAAAAALGRMGPAGAPALIKAIDDPDAAVRIHVIVALGQIGPARGITLPALMAAANDPSALIRSWALGALGRIGAESDMVIPALIKGLDDDDPDVRRSAGHRLGEIRPPGRVLPALLGVLDRGSARARAQAAYAVGGLGPEAVPASLPALLRALKDDDDRVRSGAAGAFWAFGKASAPAAPALRAALDDPCQAVRNDASGALMLIEGKMHRYE